MKALGAIASQPWAIQRDSLETILAVATRLNDSPQAVEKTLGRPLDNSQSVTMRGNVAIVPVLGPIFRYANLFTEISGGTSVENLARDFNAALDDPQVKAIVLNVNSPGGQVNGINAFAEMVYQSRGVKPVVAYVDGLAASAAYWIAAAASEIVIDETAEAGSIGVLIGVRRNDPNSPEVTFVSAQSPRKLADPDTESGRGDLQSLCDQLADIFIHKVALYRGTSAEAVQSDFGGGWVEMGRRAVEAGLADRVGSLEELIDELTLGYQP